MNVVYSSPLIRIRWGSERLLSYLNNLRVGCSQFYRRLINTCPSKWVDARGKSLNECRK
nr:MAG TPA: Cytochrome c oxidase subunit 1 [Caudoviricetes sp.]